MSTIDVDQSGKLATQPQTYGLGPFYNNIGGAYQGPDPLAPPVWTGDEAGGGASPPGALDFSSGDVAPVNWQDYNPGNTSTGGGFFTEDQLSAAQGQSIVPPSFQSGSNMPSTNNWRLLGGQYRQPNYIMRNGNVINLNHPWLRHPFGQHLQSYVSGASDRNPSAMGPASSREYNWTATGWPGSDNWAITSFMSAG